MKKIGFVIPWYADDIPGGAEADLRGLAKNMQKRGIEVEILTTCVKEFLARWDKNYYEPGLADEGGLTVRRFPIKNIDLAAFGEVNLKLMKGQHILSNRDEKIYVDNMVGSDELCTYIREHKDEYSVFAFTPYMFGTTYWGVQECYEKAVLIPCFHDEAYTYMRCFRKVYSRAAGMAFHAKPEYQLIDRLYDLSNVEIDVAGDGMDVDLTFDANRFREKYHMDAPFILYAGRKDVGKNIYTLLDYFHEYKYRHKDSELKLILLGGGKVDIPDDMKGEIIDLGFVPKQDKYDAYGAAQMLCQPSKNESFSLVIMESWLCERPTLVCKDCAVTKNFAIESKGGLYFKNYFDFEGAVDFYLNNPEAARQMGLNGKKYVQENFNWDRVVGRYMDLFERVVKKSEEGCSSV